MFAAPPFGANSNNAPLEGQNQTTSWTGGCWLGPVADDNMALLFRQYENEIIDFGTLLRGMIYKKTSSQYSFHTEKSIKLLRKVGI